MNFAFISKTLEAQAKALATARAMAIVCLLGRCKVWGGAKVLTGFSAAFIVLITLKNTPFSCGEILQGREEQL